MANLGEKRLSLEVEQDKRYGAIASVFQIAQVTRPLMSVGKVCDEGLKVTFDSERADVCDTDGKIVCSFRRRDGGLYVAKRKLKQLFGRQG